MKLLKISTLIILIALLTSCSWKARDWAKAGVEVAVGAATYGVLGTDFSRDWSTWVVDSVVAGTAADIAGEGFDAVMDESDNSYGKEYKDLQHDEEEMNNGR